MDPYKLVKRHLLDITPYKPGKPIEELKREYAIEDVIKIASNENALGPSPKAVGALFSSLWQVNRYPDGTGYILKNALAKKLGLKRENIILGNGSDEIIVFAVRAFCSSEDEVIIADPTFMMYMIASKQEGVKVKYVPLENYKYNLNAIRAKVTKKTKLIFIANPDNPTGSYITKEQIENFMNSLPKHVIVFFDEAYFEYVTKKDYPRTIKYIKDRNVIIARTFSKIYGLAGLRIGYGIASESIINILNYVRGPFNVNMLALVGATAALSDKEHVRKTKQSIADVKKYIYSQLEKMGIEYCPSEANFILIDFKKETGSIYEELLKKGIIVREMKAWKLQNHIRITMGLKEEAVRFISALKEIMKTKENRR